MSILTSSSGTSVSRGYDYYKREKVTNINQLNDDEFEGYVQGTEIKPYYVKININHPRKSTCDCPHANGNIICKHMVALYFELFPEEVEDYESWLNSDYDEEDDYYDYYDEDDDYYDDYDRTINFDKPLFFDEVLEKYISELSVDELRKNLMTELKYNEKRAYEVYLEKNYKSYLFNDKETFLFLDKMNKKVNDLTNYIDYNYSRFDDKILNANERQKIENLYKDNNLRNAIDKIFFNEKLAVYSDYIWIANFYKKHKNSDEIFEFIKVLENYLDSLKHYSIKNSIPKSNLLIIMYILSNNSEKEKANLLLNNARYLEFVDYVIDNTKNKEILYKEFLNLIDKNYFKNKTYIPDILYRFNRYDYDNKEMEIIEYLYSYLCLGHEEYLRILSIVSKKEDVIKFIENRTKDVNLLMKLYKFYGETEKLWNLINNTRYRYLLINNAVSLKEKYSNELYEHFNSEFYSILKEGKNRDVYSRASKYITAINNLNNGVELVNSIISDLKNSDYQKCFALFDEINKALK